MIFLVEYNRSEGNIVALRSFADAQRQEAENSRLEMELTLNRKKVNHEVVLLEADSEAALRRTHQRYFGDFRRLPAEQPNGRTSH